MTVQIMFSGLILFVRDPDTDQITHVLLREARRHGSHRHDPYLCVRSDQTPTDLGREQLSFEWKDQGGNSLPVAQAGARPEGRVSDAVGLPQSGQEELFYWTPHVDQFWIDAPQNNPYVDRSLLGVAGVSEYVAASVLLGTGRIYTGDFAFSEDKGVTPVTPVIQFKDPTGKTKREQAASEKVVWTPRVPDGAVKLVVRSVSFHDADTAPPSVERRTFDLEADEPLLLTISNNPPPHYKRYPRPPGTEAEHFGMLYDLLTDPRDNEKQPPRERVMPWVPQTYYPKPAGSFSQNVLKYAERSTGFQDCHRCRKDLDKGVKERPICIPLVADAAEKTEE